MLEDQAGFVNRDQDFEFRLESQIIGPVEILEENKLQYYLSLPSVPQGAFVDVDQNEKEDQGVQVFAIAYWSNIWGDPFLETRDGTGWSNAYASTITDPENEYELTGGTLIVWAPDEKQGFPTGFGADGRLFTSDDPTASISPGYNLVDLNTEPFRFYKESNPIIDLIEGEIAINDFSDLDYGEAFEAMFNKVSQEYPFTQEKRIDWPALQKKFSGLAEKAKGDQAFFEVVQAFSQSIPDGHANISLNPDVFYQEYGGGFGLLLTELSDGTVIVTEVLADMPAEQASIQPGAQIITWNQKPISEAISEVIPGFGPSSTQHTHRLAQTSFLTRTSPQSEVTVSFINPNDTKKRESKLKTIAEYETVFRLLNVFNDDQLALPIEGSVLDESGLGYIRLTTFSDDYQLMARLWEHYLASLQEERIPGVIIDLRNNSGGSLGLALDFAGFFFDEEFPLYQSAYYSHQSGQFEYTREPAKIQPAPLVYEGEIAVLIGPDCVSACEGFAYALSSGGRAILVGHYPTAGAFGEVGRGQYKLPGDISLQFPTGRPETLDGNLLIEGTGVQPDILVPITRASALGQVDAVLDAAIQALLDRID
jgi:C-terminal processing protease CtpA/Prc